MIITIWFFGEGLGEGLEKGEGLDLNDFCVSINICYN
jgi:hypothetical protein